MQFTFKREVIDDYPPKEIFDLMAVSLDRGRKEDVAAAREFFAALAAAMPAGAEIEGDVSERPVGDVGDDRDIIILSMRVTVTKNPRRAGARKKPVKDGSPVRHMLPSEEYEWLKGHSVEEGMEALGVSRATYYRRMKGYAEWFSEEGSEEKSHD